MSEKKSYTEFIVARVKDKNARKCKHENCFIQTEYRAGNSLRIKNGKYYISSDGEPIPYKYIVECEDCQEIYTFYEKSNIPKWLRAYLNSIGELDK